MSSERDTAPTAPDGGATIGGPGQRAWSAQALLGQVLGKYRVEALLGEGGMGVVLRAAHVDLGRQVALKVLRPVLACREELVARLFAEARTVNDIGHPRIVEISDFARETWHGVPLVYTVMELLRGQDLARKLDRDGPLSAPLAIQMVLQVLDALGAAHRQGIVHRDLKPANIFLLDHSADVDGADAPTPIKLLDFGTLKDLGGDARADLTAPGEMVGTPEFMAPEQILGDPLDARTDIYAVGLTLYAMLSGRVPFAATHYGDVLVAQVNQAPPDLPAEMLARDPAAMSALSLVIQRCLSKAPKDRYQSTTDLDYALRAIAPTVERGPPQPSLRTAAAGTDRPPRPSRRRFGLAFCAIATLCALVGIAATLGVNRVRFHRRNVRPAPIQLTATTVERAAPTPMTDASQRGPDAAVVSQSSATRANGSPDASSSAAVSPNPPASQSIEPTHRRSHPRGRARRRHRLTQGTRPTAPLQPAPDRKKMSKPDNITHGILNPYSN